MLVCVVGIGAWQSGCTPGSSNRHSWSFSENLFDTKQGYFCYVDLVKSKDDIYGLFFDSDAQGGEAIIFKRDQGVEKISTVSVEKDASYRFLIAGTDDLYLFGYNRGIVYKKSEDRGKTWSDDIQPEVDMSTMDAKDISPIIVSNRLHIFCSGREPSMSISVDQAMKKMPEQPIHLSILLLNENDDTTWKMSEIFLCDVSIPGRGLSRVQGCWHNGILHVVWTDWSPIDRGYEAVFYSRSEDRGLTWTSPVILAERVGGSGYSDFVNISANETGLHVCWPDWRHRKTYWSAFIPPFGGIPYEENYEIYYRRSSDYGKTWEKDIRISEGISHSYYPSMAVEGSHIAIVWTGNKRPRRKYFYRAHPTDLWIRESFDGGNTWGPISKIEDCAKEGYSIHKPKIVLKDGRRHLLYIKGKHTIQEGPGLHLLREPPYEVLYRESVGK